jgi:alpha-tubulin suppressor-like RCC1 family protein
MALKTDGTLVPWGDNTDGQTTVPSGTTQVTAIAAGASHALALRADFIPAQVARLDQENVFTEKLGILRTAAANELEVEGQASKTTANYSYVILRIWFFHYVRRCFRHLI